MKVEVQLIDWNAGGEDTIIKAARTCYDSGDKSTPESDDRLIESLIRNGHHAMLEFGWAAFRVKCSRVVSHELVRMRLCSFAQRSQRYVNESEPSYVTPPELLNRDLVGGSYAAGMFDYTVRQAWNAYHSLLTCGVPKQIARYVLPNACMTELVVAANYREWRHVCELRTGRAAQPEMRQVATLILKELKQLAPRIFNDISLPTDVAI